MYVYINTYAYNNAWRRLGRVIQPGLESWNRGRNVIKIESQNLKKKNYRVNYVLNIEYVTVNIFFEFIVTCYVLMIITLIWNIMKHIGNKKWT